MESFGARLRRRREEQDIALSTVAELTKIKSSLLAALERDDLSHWPSGFFRRAFIRAYADAIGLNPDDVVREFLETHPEPAAVSEPVQTSGPAPTRFRDMVDSALSRWRRPPVTAVPAPTESALHAPIPPIAPAFPEPDFQAVAQLCTQIARAKNPDDLPPLLRDAARILDAIGLIVWVWDAPGGELKPAMAYGYSAKVLAQVPPVKRDAANATAAAFRSGEPCAISGNGRARGALVVPLFARAGCAGVLAIELPRGGEQPRSVLAIATIFAAQLAQSIGDRPTSDAVTSVQTSNTFHLATALAEG